MRQDGRRGRAPRGWRPTTTDSAHAHPIAPNLLGRQFDVKGVGLNRIWVSDITYVPTRSGWLYLATVLDLASRRVVGWAMRDTLDAELALSALRMAIAARHPAPGLIHHSDRGSQYACAAYQTLLAAHGMLPSMSRKANCWDNAVAESFFATLEFELIMNATWETRDDGRRAIFSLYRDVVQSSAPALDPRLRQPGDLRSATPERGISTLKPVSTKPGQAHTRGSSQPECTGVGEDVTWARHRRRGPTGSRPSMAQIFDAPRLSVQALSGSPTRRFSVLACT
jgi:hypothetical protein